MLRYILCVILLVFDVMYFLQMYTTMHEAYLMDPEKHSESVTSFAVQLFTVPSIARYRHLLDMVVHCSNFVNVHELIFEIQEMILD